MSYAWDAIQSHVASLIEEAGVGVRVTPQDLVAPPNPELGDLSYACFAAAKELKKNPAEVAAMLASKIKPDHSVEGVSAAGPYLNVTLHAGDVVNRVVKDVENHGRTFGRPVEPMRGRLMLEYAQPNTHKEIHVGHLRNLVIGVSLSRLLAAVGWDVVASSYHGDVGAHVAKCLWLFVRRGSVNVKPLARKRKKKDEPELPPFGSDAWADDLLEHLTADAVEAMLKAVPREERTGKMLGHLYSESTKVLEENPQWKPQVSEVLRKLEAKDPAWIKLWRETRRWSLVEMDEIFQDLGVAIERQYFESEVMDEGQRIVDDLMSTGVAKTSQGAVVVDLESQKLGVFLIRKSDGTSLYATKDLALAFLKLREYPDLSHSLVLVDNRQALYFKQLFATLKLMGLSLPLEFVGYEFVTLKSGAMSSREGNIVTWQSFREEVLRYAAKETRTRHEDWNEGKCMHTAWSLMMGGIKFGMLRQDSDKIYVFDLEKALSFDGATGPYVQYAATRLSSILRKATWKAEKDGKTGDLAQLSQAAEKRLALAIAAFPAAVARAATERRPALMAQWCYDLATRANEFYRDVNVLESEPEMKAARLRLVAASRDALLIGLELLGIPVPEEM